MTWTRSVAVLSLLLLLLAGCTASPPDPTGTPSASADPVELSATQPPAPSPSSTTFGAPATERIGTTGWVPYTSERYGFTIMHPPDWSISPAEETWTIEHTRDFANLGQERFFSPDGNIFAAAWATPYSGEETLTAVQTWVERYCAESAGVRCATIGERGVRLCHEPDCHPGLLVPASSDVHAFFTGGAHRERMIVVRVGRPADPNAGDYGAAREVLEALLSTMDVWPQP
jgi:hypothetical protein